MHFRKGKTDLSVMEAVDNLSHMAEIDVAVPEEEKPLELTEEQLSERMHTLSWNNPEYNAYNRDRIRETFLAIHKYIKELYEKGKSQLNDEETQRGIQAMMLLATEAAHKIDNFTGIFKNDPEVKSAVELKEYRDLQNFYLNHIVKSFHKLVEVAEKWQEEWGAGLDEDRIGVHKGGLKDLESVRRDKEYELFSIRKEDGHPFFNRSLLHHMQLIGQFDFMLPEVTFENPFLRVPAIQDREAHLAAKEIMQLASAYMVEFYKEALKFKKMEYASSINKGLMALMLAANPRNLMHTAAGKSCLDYFTDFHTYLRAALRSKEYQRLIAHPPDLSEHFIHALINLTHVLSASFFLRTIDRKDMIAYIHLLIEKGARGSVMQSQTASPLSLWNNLLDQDDNLRFLLKQNPNGPIKTTLRLLSQDKQLTGFDPLAQDNFPGILYMITGGDMHISCLRLPGPTFQVSIDKAKIADEFYGFLRSIGSQKRNQKHLLINLQDRTSWFERARCSAIEGIQKKRGSHRL